MRKILTLIAVAGFALIFANAPPIYAAAVDEIDAVTSSEIVAADITLDACQDANAERLAGLTFEERAGLGFVPAIQATPCAFNFLSAPPGEPGDDGGG